MYCLEFVKSDLFSIVWVVHFNDWVFLFLCCFWCVRGANTDESEQVWACISEIFFLFCSSTNCVSTQVSKGTNSQCWKTSTTHSQQQQKKKLCRPWDYLSYGSITIRWQQHVIQTVIRHRLGERERESLLTKNQFCDAIPLIARDTFESLGDRGLIGT